MESNILSNLKELSTELAAQPDTWKQMAILEVVTTIEALQQENEQLQAHVAQYREALIIANHRMPDVGQFCACGKCKTCGATISYAGYEYCVKCARVIIDEALSDTPTAYHNPADVAEIEQRGEWIDQQATKILRQDAALAKARETLISVSFRSGLGSDAEPIREALAAIDKIGGREDA